MTLTFDIHDGVDLDHLYRQVYLWCGREERCHIRKSPLAWIWNVEISVRPSDNVMSLMPMLDGYTKSVYIKE